MRQLTRRTLLATGAAFAAAPAIAGPASKLIGGPWKSFGSGGDPDYTAWANFLDRYRTVGGNGVALVRYGQAASDGARLTDQLEAMQAVDPTMLSRDAAMAYWLNLYNILTIDLVVDAFPVSSIKKVRGGIFNTGPWTEKLVTVAGQRLSLDDIEHGILRPVWKDPRIHYGVNCASIGCPDLDARPFVAGDLDVRLTAAAESFTSHPRGARQESSGAVVSTIYEWFIEDFGGTEDGIISHVNKHRAQPVAGPVDDYEYDWSLNAA
ncbi:MAG: DUF547 domain-containing protein [Pseudomonadota bacterium]